MKINSALFFYVLVSVFFVSFACDAGYPKRDRMIMFFETDDKNDNTRYKQLYNNRFYNDEIILRETKSKKNTSTFRKVIIAFSKVPNIILKAFKTTWHTLSTTYMITGMFSSTYYLFRIAAGMFPEVKFFIKSRDVMGKIENFIIDKAAQSVRYLISWKFSKKQ